MKELIERLRAIPKMIGRMCSEGTPPKMSIPARPDYDEDLRIVAAVKEAIAALEAADVREAELRARVAELEGMCIEYVQAIEAHINGKAAP